MADTPAPLFCDRCSRMLRSGHGDYYVVKIEAVADPTPPSFSDDDLQKDPRREIERLAAELEGVSPQEAIDQVYRRLTLFLCTRCYTDWIEDPTGNVPGSES